MNRTEGIKEFAKLVRGLAKFSICKRRGVACIVLTHKLQVVGWGVNGPAGNHQSMCSGEKDKCGCLHSEVNTILNCKFHMDTILSQEPCIMIASRAPCVPCATAIVNCGFIGQMYVLDKSEPGDHGIAVLEGCNVRVEWLDVPEGAEIGLRATAKQ